MCRNLRNPRILHSGLLHLSLSTGYSNLESVLVDATRLLELSCLGEQAGRPADRLRIPPDPPSESRYTSGDSAPTLGHGVVGFRSFGRRRDRRAPRARDKAGELHSRTVCG